MRILHFSDPHLGLFPHGFGWLFDKRLLGTLTQHLRRRHKQDFSFLDTLTETARKLAPDVIVCTGDLCSIAAPAEFDRALNALAPLRELSHGNFLYVPGNHDAYVNRPESIQARLNAVKILNFLPPDIENLPVTRKINNLTFLLLDAACPRPPWGSGGVATLTQHAAILRELIPPKAPAEIRLLVSHFPLFTANGRRLGWRRGLKRDTIFRNLVKNHLLDACLCGHIHSPFLYSQDQFTQICPGSLTLKHHVACIDTDDTSGTFTVRLINLSHNQP